MSGDNDVEYTINHPSLLSDLDSLTEQSLESLAAAATAVTSPATAPSKPDDDIFLMRLNEMRTEVTRDIRRHFLHPLSSAPTSASAASNSAALIDSLQLDLGNFNSFGLSSRHFPPTNDIRSLVNNKSGKLGIAPRPSLGSSGISRSFQSENIEQPFSILNISPDPIQSSQMTSLTTTTTSSSPGPGSLIFQPPNPSSFLQVINIRFLGHLIFS